MTAPIDIDTGTDELLCAVRDGVAIITLNRPQARNALSDRLTPALRRMIKERGEDPSVGALLITGAGTAFCAGGDVKGMAAGTNRGGPGTTLDERIHRQRLSQRETAGRIFRMPKPVIASLPGAAAGAGLSLALACDLRIAAESAVITTAFAKVGFSGDYGGTYFLTHLVGAAKARELYYLSDRIDAKEAERLGLVNRVVPDASLESETRALAARIATGAAVAFRYMKENLNRAQECASAEECLDLEATHHVHTGLTEDHRDAAKAFVEKRTPVFKGR